LQYNYWVLYSEAYADAQGWVEGALQTADIMLKKVIENESVSTLQSV